jgi:hypothetical protein
MERLFTCAFHRRLVLCRSRTHAHFKEGSPSFFSERRLLFLRPRPRWSQHHPPFGRKLANADNLASEYPVW